MDLAPSSTSLRKRLEKRAGQVPACFHHAWNRRPKAACGILGEASKADGVNPNPASLNTSHVDKARMSSSCYL